MPTDRSQILVDAFRNEYDTGRSQQATLLTELRRKSHYMAARILLRVFAVLCCIVLLVLLLVFFNVRGDMESLVIGVAFLIVALAAPVAYGVTQAVLDIADAALLGLASIGKADRPTQ